MIPRIEKINEENDYAFLRLEGYKYIVIGTYGQDATFTLIQAIRYWLWHCGVPAKIAFYKVKAKIDDYEA
jgi:hypothetical protein